tara:strand:+ start:180 stop:1040 length:861 start_codon:yes stop_codon:yes gene_type:complete
MSTQSDKDLVYLGGKVDWEDTSNAAIWIDLEDAAAQGIKINEYVSGQTSPSIEVENNAGTTVFQVLASATTAAAFTHTVSTTTGNGMILTANALTTGSGLSVNSSATAITTTGRLLEVFHTGATSTSGVIAEISSAAADETVVCRITASAALAGGVLMDLSAAAVTTGTVLDIGGLDALTTGVGVQIESDSADTGAWTALNIVVDNTAATASKPVAIQNDADTYSITCTGATTKGIDLSALSAGEASINFVDGSASSIDPSATAESGWINIAVGGTIKYVPYYAAS